MARQGVLAVVLALAVLLAGVAAADCRSNELPADCYARTGYLPSGYALHLWDLASLSSDDYDSLWARGVCPQTSEMRGNKFSGITIQVKFGTLGKEVFKVFTDGAVDALFSNSFSSAPLTFRKRFYQSDDSKGQSGINWWTMKKGESLPMKIYVSRAEQGVSGDSLKIDYDVTDNNALTERPLLDEIRRLPGTNTYLGKMYFRALGKPVFFLWFALEKQ